MPEESNFMDHFTNACINAALHGRLTQLSTALDPFGTHGAIPENLRHVRVIVVPERMDIYYPPQSKIEIPGG